MTEDLKKVSRIKNKDIFWKSNQKKSLEFYEFLI